MTAFPSFRRAALAFVAALLTAPALQAAPAGEAVYRCGPAGSVYTSVPCADGVRLAVADRPDDARRADAQAVAQRDLALAAQMRAQRLAREAETGGALAGGIGHSRPRAMAAQDIDNSPGRAHDHRCESGRSPRHGSRAAPGAGACGAAARDPRVTHEIRLPRAVKTVKVTKPGTGAKSPSRATSRSA